MHPALVRIVLVLGLILAAVAAVVTATNDPPVVPPGSSANPSGAASGSSGQVPQDNATVIANKEKLETKLLVDAPDALSFFLILLLGGLGFLDMICACGGSASGGAN